MKKLEGSVKSLSKTQKEPKLQARSSNDLELCVHFSKACRSLKSGEIAMGMTEHDRC